MHHLLTHLMHLYFLPLFQTSCGGDWWQLGSYTYPAAKQLGAFAATAGWEDMFGQRKIDMGHFYASKVSMCSVCSVVCV